MKRGRGLHFQNKITMNISCSVVCEQDREGWWVEKKRDWTASESFISSGLYIHLSWMTPSDLQTHAFVGEPVITSTYVHSTCCLTRALQQSEREKRMSNTKHTHTYCTYTAADTPDLQRRLLRPNMWEATCIQSKDPWRPSAFKLPLMELVRLHNTLLSEQILSIEWKNTNRLVSSKSSDLQLFGAVQQHVVNVKETSKPERRQRTRRPS